MSWTFAAAVALGGALGALGRYMINVLVMRFQIAFQLGYFPLATFTANVLGSFVLGVLAGGLLERLPMGETIRGFLVTGLLGGFTTFSAFSLELGEMVVQKQFGLALGYGGLSAVAGPGAFLLGLAFMRGIVG